MRNWIVVFFILLTSPVYAEDVVVRVKQNLIRIVTAEDVTALATTPTPLGDVKVMLSLPKRCECNVILDAEEVEASVFFGDDTPGTVPNVPELRNAFAKVRPYKIPNSESAVGSWMWNAMLKDADCTKVLDFDEFALSTMMELISAAPIAKARLLRAYGMDEDPETHEPIYVVVPWGDARALPDQVWKIPHQWAGREHDLGFNATKDGKIIPRTAVEAKAVEVTP